MPYPGIPPSKTKAMERCVADLMADPDFKPKKGRTKKESAIAVCHASIMGTKKADMITKITFKVENMKEIIAKTLAEEIAKRIEITSETNLTRKEVKKEVKKVEKKLKKKETKAVEEKTEKIEKVEKAKVEKKVEKEKEVKLEKVEKKAEVKKEEKKEEKAEVKVDSETLLQKLTDAIGSLTTEVKSLSKLVKVPAEEAAKVEKTPKVEVEKAPKEEVEKVEKKETEDTSSGETSAKLLKELEDIKKRLEEVEKSPAKTKVVVSKGFGGEADKEEGRLEKIDKRLEELHKIRKDKPADYGNSHMEEAFKLLDEKAKLLK